uniref:NAD-dependent epimerase/dehydratase family protein n=1 Tax=Anaerococcus mediterraneensis TaxID=1870984 RepID=UPI00092FF1C6|nr:NAD(P)-dependent oxidoreductase [Anaerococcus mediterraneensis]
MKNVKKIFILGGATLFGSQTIKYALDEGYEIVACDLIKRDDLEENENLSYILEDFFSLGDAAATDLIGDCDSFIYAGGVDDLTVPRKPAGKFFYERNVLPTGRVARISKKAGVKNFLLLGDYRSEIAEKNYDLRKHNYHKEPYIDTRLMQESIAIYEGDGLMNVSILRPGVIVGRDNRSALLAHIALAEKLKNIPVTQGIIPLISAKSLAKAAIFALELGSHKKTYALRDTNISYHDLYTKIIETLDLSDKKLIDKSFDDLEPAYLEDEKISKKRGLEHGISQTNILRSASYDLSIDSDFDIASPDIDEDLADMITYLDKILKGK